MRLGSFASFGSFGSLGSLGSFFVWGALALGGLSGCKTTLIPFTHELKDQHRLSDGDLKNLQYYVSSTVILRRELGKAESSVTPGHKLRVFSGKTIEEVVIEKETPGVAMKVEEGKLAVSFEPGAALDFGVDGALVALEPEPAQPRFAEGPNPFPGNGAPPPPPAPSSLFTGNYWLGVDGRGEVTYQGKTWAVTESGGRAHLLIDAEALEKVVKNRKVLPGVRLASAPRAAVLAR